MERTEVKYQDGKRFVAENWGHKVTIDVPKELGGSDAGPTPPELFIDALGACIGVHVVGFCTSTGINTDGLKIKIDWEKQVKEKPFSIKSINVAIDLPNADVGPRKDALIKVAHSCLIHQTIKAQPKISINLT